MKPGMIMIAAGASLVLLLVVRPWTGDATPAVIPAPSVAAPETAHPSKPRYEATARVQGELAKPHAEVSRLGAAPAPEEELSPEEQRARHDQRAAAQAALLAKAFAADTRDPSWSPQTEHALRDAFSAAALPGAQLEEVTCGATLCRFRVAFDSIQRRDEGMGAVIGLVRWRSLSFGDASPDDPLRYIVYAARDPENFPKLE